MNQLVSTFGPPDIHLSPSNLERIEDLNTRWRLLQVHCHAQKHTRAYSGIETLMILCRYIHRIYCTYLHLDTHSCPQNLCQSGWLHTPQSHIQVSKNMCNFLTLLRLVGWNMLWFYYNFLIFSVTITTSWVCRLSDAVLHIWNDKCRFTCCNCAKEFSVKMISRCATFCSLIVKLM